jgi:hypothetical protein
VALVPSSSRGGGGGTPAGNETEVQYNDDGDFGADSGWKYVASAGNRTIHLVSTANGTADIRGGALGVQLHLRGGDGDATHVGGEVNLTAGTSAGQSGGAVTVTAGNDSAGGAGGDVTIQSGGSVGADGGDISIVANPSGAAGDDGGQIVITGGAGTDHGGAVTVQAGAPDGAVYLANGIFTQSVQVDNDGLTVATTKVGFYSTPPVVQPTGVAVTAAAIHAALVALGLITT